MVADTSPINYLNLIIIGHVGILPRLYPRLFIHPSVLQELRQSAAPRPVRDWVLDAPEWLEVRSPNNPLPATLLDEGERDAIALALELAAVSLLMDDAAGRLEATGSDSRLPERWRSWTLPI